MRTLIFLFVFITISFTQNTKAVDVVYLNDGSIIKGDIIEIIPNETIKIKIIGGNVFVFQMSTVKSIKQEIESLSSVEQDTKTDKLINETKKYPGFDSSYNPNEYSLLKNIGRIGGASVGLATMIGSLAMGDEYFGTTVIPIVGPFITYFRVESDPYSTFLPGGEELLLIAGITQVGFFSLWIISLISESTYKSEHRLSLMPNTNNVGFTLSYNF